MTKYIDVFNGDADGLCALIQLRLENPQESDLITGVKRDINLLKKVNAQDGTHITALDISFEKNVIDVQRLLDQGCSISYIDHHKTGELINHPQLKTDIDLSADTCTSLIIDKKLQGRYRAWAITAAFGDNLIEKAYQLGTESGFAESELEMLKELGVCLNYNGYGACLDDLYFHPKNLYKILKKYKTPFDFLQNDTETLETLINGYRKDMDLAEKVSPQYSTSYSEAIILPNEKWARRVSGVFCNELANKSPNKAYAILTKKAQGDYLVSIRAPLNRKQGADTVATKFPTGGGRRSAAGIQSLPKIKLEKFVKEFNNQFEGN